MMRKYQKAEKRESQMRGNRIFLPLLLLKGECIPFYVKFQSK